MELLGIFHKKTFMEARGVCDAPYIEKGGHALAARDAATGGGVMACALLLWIWSEIFENAAPLPPQPENPSDVGEE